MITKLKRIIYCTVSFTACYQLVFLIDIVKSKEGIVFKIVETGLSLPVAVSAVATFYNFFMIWVNENDDNSGESESK